MNWEDRARELFADALAERHGAKIAIEQLNSNHIRAAIKLGCEMADARAEEIAKKADSCINAQDANYEIRHWCANVARSISWFARHGKEKLPREQTLEIALRDLIRSIPHHAGMGEAFHESGCGLCRPIAAARRALE